MPSAKKRDCLLYQHSTRRMNKMTKQTQMNLAYGLKIRLQGLIRRGEAQEKIDAVREKYEAAIREIEKDA